MPLLRVLHYLWASPATALGLLFAPAAWMSGGRVRCVDGVVEIHGGLVQRFLAQGLPVIGSASAMTLGHAVIGQDQACLDDSRTHERVHVRQYERWGPLMIPAYLLASLWAYLRRRHPYWDNPFEREANQISDRGEA
ncbi:MAG: hypothetical protein JO250_00920 [Armatimonadetes bacterium]|nr:hypothetical protein [Armatimonadota bacterium]